jgi:hypothetical protein
LPKAAPTLLLRGGPSLAPLVAGLSGNENGLLHLGHNKPKVVMRGLGPRIHAVVGDTSGRRAGVDGRIKSGHDDRELSGQLCAFGSVRAGNFPGQPCACGERVRVYGTAD